MMRPSTMVTQSLTASICSWVVLPWVWMSMMRPSTIVTQSLIASIFRSWVSTVDATSATSSRDWLTSADRSARSTRSKSCALTIFARSSKTVVRSSSEADNSVTESILSLYDSTAGSMFARRFSMVLCECGATFFASAAASSTAASAFWTRSESSLSWSL